MRGTECAETAWGCQRCRFARCRCCVLPPPSPPLSFRSSLHCRLLPLLAGCPLCGCAVAAGLAAFAAASPSSCRSLGWWGAERMWAVPGRPAVQSQDGRKGTVGTYQPPRIHLQGWPPVPFSAKLGKQQPTRVQMHFLINLRGRN
jgi:hypothetical protein